MQTRRSRKALYGILLGSLVSACTSTTTPPAPLDITSYEMTRAMPLEARPGAYALSPDASFLILTYAGNDPSTAYDFYRVDLDTAETEKIVTPREYQDGNFTIPLRASGAAKAVAVADSGAFYANWPGRLVKVAAETGELSWFMNLGTSSSGSNMAFNQMSLTEDGSTLFGIGSDFVRISLADGAGEMDRAMALEGGRTMAVFSPTKAASSSVYDKVAIAVAGEPEPLCEVDPGAKPTYMAASQDDQYLASVLWFKDANNMGVTVWSAADCSVVNEWSMGEDKITRVAWLPGSSTLATTGFGEVTFWDAVTGAKLHTLKTNDDSTMITLFSEDGRRLVTLSPWSDEEIRVFDAR